MTNASEADRAITALNGTDLGGRTLTISAAKPKSERPGAEATDLAVEEAMDATIIAPIQSNRANRAGSFRGQMWARSGCQMPCRRSSKGR
jgi:hypothetical protein